jgi:hypothetical protein
LVFSSKGINCPSNKREPQGSALCCSEGRQWAQHNEEAVHSCCLNAVETHITIMSARCSNVCNIIRCRPELLFVAESTDIAQHSSVVLASRSVGYASWDPDIAPSASSQAAKLMASHKNSLFMFMQFVLMFYMSVEYLCLGRIWINAPIVVQLDPEFASVRLPGFPA